jgi:hypothetical protein
MQSLKDEVDGLRREDLDLRFALNQGATMKNARATPGKNGECLPKTETTDSALFGA